MYKAVVFTAAFFYEAVDTDRFYQSIAVRKCLARSALRLTDIAAG
ncbi:hypothetical protein BSG1_09613 [Bacillus sp. SG-1]|nr:hypothetical protein BSG1_09613 [Bacillus sp. SG-1]